MPFTTFSRTTKCAGSPQMSVHSQYRMQNFIVPNPVQLNVEGKCIIGTKN